VEQEVQHQLLLEVVQMVVFINIFNNYISRWRRWSLLQSPSNKDYQEVQVVEELILIQEQVEQVTHHQLVHHKEIQEEEIAAFPGRGAAGAGGGGGAGGAGTVIHRTTGGAGRWWNRIRYINYQDQFT
jgi:hypothetical protein